MNTSTLGKDSSSSKAEHINELAVMHWEAERFLEKLQSEVKTITDVYEGKELLTPATLLRCNVAVMIVHQLAANITRIAGNIKAKLPSDYQERDGDIWLTLATQLITDSKMIADQAISRAKEISKWASVCIDGTVYPL